MFTNDRKRIQHLGRVLRAAATRGWGAQAEVTRWPKDDRLFRLARYELSVGTIQEMQKERTVLDAFRRKTCGERDKKWQRPEHPWQYSQPGPVKLSTKTDKKSEAYCQAVKNRFEAERDVKAIERLLGPGVKRTGYKALYDFIGYRTEHLPGKAGACMVGTYYTKNGSRVGREITAHTDIMCEVPVETLLPEEAFPLHETVARCHEFAVMRSPAMSQLDAGSFGWEFESGLPLRLDTYFRLRPLCDFLDAHPFRFPLTAEQVLAQRIEDVLRAGGVVHELKERPIPPMTEKDRRLLKRALVEAEERRNAAEAKMRNLVPDLLCRKREDRKREKAELDTLDNYITERSLDELRGLKSRNFAPTPRLPSTEQIAQRIRVLEARIAKGQEKKRPDEGRIEVLEVQIGKLLKLRTMITIERAAYKDLRGPWLQQDMKRIGETPHKIERQILHRPTMNADPEPYGPFFGRRGPNSHYHPDNFNTNQPEDLTGYPWDAVREIAFRHEVMTRTHATFGRVGLGCNVGRMAGDIVVPHRCLGEIKTKGGRLNELHNIPTWRSVPWAGNLDEYLANPTHLHEDHEDKRDELNEIVADALPQISRSDDTRDDHDDEHWATERRACPRDADGKAIKGLEVGEWNYAPDASADERMMAMLPNVELEGYEDAIRSAAQKMRTTITEAPHGKRREGRDARERVIESWSSGFLWSEMLDALRHEGETITPLLEQIVWRWAVDVAMPEQSKTDFARYDDILTARWTCGDLTKSVAHTKADAFAKHQLGTHGPKLRQQKPHWPELYKVSVLASSTYTGSELPARRKGIGPHKLKPLTGDRRDEIVTKLENKFREEFLAIEFFPKAKLPEHVSRDKDTNCPHKQDDDYQAARDRAWEDSSTGSAILDEHRKSDTHILNDLINLQADLAKGKKGVNRRSALPAQRNARCVIEDTEFKAAHLDNSSRYKIRMTGLTEMMLSGADDVDEDNRLDLGTSTDELQAEAEMVEAEATEALGAGDDAEEVTALIAVENDEISVASDAAQSALEADFDDSFYSLADGEYIGTYAATQLGEWASGRNPTLEAMDREREEEKSKSEGKSARASATKATKPIADELAKVIKLKHADKLAMGTVRRDVISNPQNVEPFDTLKIVTLDAVRARKILTAAKKGQALRRELRVTLETQIEQYQALTKG